MKRKITLTIIALLAAHSIWACGILVNGSATTSGICLGQPVSLALDNNGCAAGAFTWTATVGATTTTLTNITNLTPTASTTYTATYGSDIYSVFVKVWTTPPSGTAIMNGLPYVACQGNSYTITAGNNSSVTSYTISTPVGTLINGQVSPVTIDAGSSFQLTFGQLPANYLTWNICIFGSNPCGNTATFCEQIASQLPQPQPLVFTGGANIPVVCPGDVITATTSIASLNHYAGIITGYAWTYPGSGGTVITPNPSVTFTVPAGFTTGQVCVQAYNANCTTMPALQRCRTIQINPAQPTGPVTASPSLVCTAGTYTFSCGGSPGASGYRFIIQQVCTQPPGVTNLSTITTNCSSCTSVTYNLASNLPPGCSIRVRVNPISPCNNAIVPNATLITDFSSAPAQPVISGPQYGVCGVAATYGTVYQSGVTGYNWTWSAGITANGPTTSNYINLNFPGSGSTPHTLSVSAINACATSVPALYTVDPLPLYTAPSNPYADIWTYTSEAYGACEEYEIFCDANMNGTTSYTGVTYRWQFDFGPLNSVPYLISGCTPTSSSNSSLVTDCYLGIQIIVHFDSNNGNPYPIHLTMQPGNMCGFRPASPVNYIVDGVVNNDPTGLIYNFSPCTPARKAALAEETASTTGIQFIQSGNAMVIHLDAIQSQQASLLFTDMSGRTVQSEKIALTKGENNLQLSTSGFAKGIYTLSIVQQDKVFKKVVSVN